VDRRAAAGRLGRPLDRPCALPELKLAVVPAGFAHRVEGNGKSLIEVASEDQVALELIVHLLSPEPAATSRELRVGHIDIGVDPDERAIRIHTLDTPPALHGQGLGHGIVRNLAQLGRSLGLDELQVEASKIGRWAWARWGFEWMTEDDRERVLTAAAQFARCSVDGSSSRRSGSRPTSPR
jgi:GNAT superfamily N-acetyltransferase